MIEIPLLIGLFLTLGVGLLLGMVGGGGSIVVVPILVYIVGLSASTAVALSLPIVGFTSLIGGVLKARRGEVDKQAFWIFGVSGALGALVGARFTKLVPQPALLLIFAAILLVVALRMWRGRAKSTFSERGSHFARCAAAGIGVGVLTGFLGVGGGFLLVPALRHFAGQSMKTAVGTSLAIIALNATVGFLGHLENARNLLSLAALFTAASLIGLVVGLRYTGKVPQHALEKMFAAVAFAVAVYLVIMNVGGVM